MPQGFFRNYYFLGFYNTSLKFSTSFTSVCVSFIKFQYIYFIKKGKDNMTRFLDIYISFFFLSSLFPFLISYIFVPFLSLSVIHLSFSSSIVTIHPSYYLIDAYKEVWDIMQQML